MSLPRELVNLKEYKKAGLKMMDANARAYIHSGAADEISFHQNSAAYDEIWLQGDPLACFEGANMTLALFGKTYPTPIFIAPLAHQKLAHPDGELATAQAANAMNIPMIVSTFANHTLEEIAHTLSAPKWFGLYAQMRMQDTLHLAERAQNAGYEALVITIDAPIAGIRNTEQKMGFKLPKGVDIPNLEAYEMPQVDASMAFPILHGVMPHALTWEDVKVIKNATSLPVLLKGISSKRAALKALEIGVDGIILSNHGGRTLDTLVPPIKLLGDVANALQGAMPILIDGGIHRGTDILKALALGASGVLIGRPILYGLGIAGALGVAHSLKILKEEFESAMALTGCRTLAEIDEKVIFSS